ncbi:MAG: SRPBCC domain-containing protein [Myxococcales bacterium]
MASDSIVLSALIPASPKRIYQTWLSSEERATFTGSPAQIEDRVGSAFTAGGGYIAGTNRELLEGKRIVQSWRTTEFPPDAPDSLVDISFEYDKQSGGTGHPGPRRNPRGPGRNVPAGVG